MSLAGDYRFEYHSEISRKISPVGDNFGVSLGGGQAPPSFYEVLGLLRISLKISPEVFQRLPRNFSCFGF